MPDDASLAWAYTRKQSLDNFIDGSELLVSGSYFYQLALVVFFENYK